MKRIAIAVAAVLACAFAVVYAHRRASAHEVARRYAERAARPPLVDVVEVRRTTAAQRLTLPGVTHGWYESTIFARVDGYVARWYVDIGDHVEPGQTLADIETPELDARLTAARAQLEVAKARVRVQQAEAEFATTTYRRWRDAEPGVVSQQEKEDKKAGLGRATARLRAAEAQVARDRADVEHYEAFERFKHVVAPYGGTIVERRIDIGNLVSAGSSSSTTPLYRIAREDPMRVWVDVPQSAKDELMRPGTSATLFAGADDAHGIDGKIVRTAGGIDVSSKTFRVEIDVQNPTHALVTGMYVRVAFDIPAAAPVEVPAAALVFRAAGPQVAVVDGEGRVQMRRVAIARDDGKTVELASGVTAGEKVALNLSNEIAAGQKVAARAADQPATASALPPSPSR